MFVVLHLLNFKDLILIDYNSSIMKQGNIPLIWKAPTSKIVHCIFGFLSTTYMKKNHPNDAQILYFQPYFGHYILLKLI